MIRVRFDSSLTVALESMPLLDGLIPFLFSRQCRDTYNCIVRLSDSQIRFPGSITLLFGLAMPAFV
jgi:uncharacterized protein YjeT (DUF2065 family)